MVRDQFQRREDTPGSSLFARLSINGPSPGLGAALCHLRWRGVWMLHRGDRGALDVCLVDAL